MARAAHVDMRSTITRGGGVAVNLAPLLTPYRKHGRLSLRIERLPQQARFSSGSRNNNGSWSLATDELEDLAYFPPEGTSDHVLAVRIINLTGGNTLAVIDFPITSSPVPAEESAPTASGGDDQVRALREQLAQMKATLAERDAEIAHARAAGPKQAPAPEIDHAAELQAIRAELQAEFEERLAAVGAKAAADLKKQRESWAAELNTRVEAANTLAEKKLAEARDAAERDKQEILAKAAEASQSAKAEAVTHARSVWQAEETKRLASAKGEWEADEAKRLAKAKSDWESAEAKRMATAQSEWSNEEAKRLAAARKEWQAEEEGRAAKAQSSGQSDEAARLAKAKAEWQTEEAARLAKAKADWQTEETARLAKAKAEWQAEEEKRTTKAQSSGQSDEAARLAKAKAEWQTEETARLAKAKAEWQAEADKVVAEAAVAHYKSHTTEMESLRKKLETEAQDALRKAEDEWKKKETSRTKDVRAEGASSQDKHDAALATLRTKLEAEAKLEAERERWTKDEAVRLAEAEAKWRQENEKQVASAKTAASEQLKANEKEQADLQSKLTALQAQLAERETQTVAAPAADGADELRKRIESLETSLADRDAALAEAKEIIDQQARNAKPNRAPKSEDQEWRATVEAELREKYSNELNEARSRYEAAEAALAQLRIRNKDGGGRTQQELSSTRAALASREKELADLRAKFAPLDGQGSEDETGDKPASVDAATPAPAKQQFSKQFIGAVIAAACAFALLIVFYPTIEAALFPPPPPPAKTEPEAKDTARLEPAIVEKKAVLTRDAKLRADPSNTGKTVANVTKGFEVIVVEVQGKWTLVRMGSDPKAQEGWVLQSSLNEITPPEAPAPAAK